MSLDRGTSTRLSLKSLTRRFSGRGKDYSKVEDLYDTRVPLHNEDAFSHGLRFKAKFIGSLEISRPTCKVDIITAMRRIRYEFKVKGVRKIRCNLNISTQGVRVSKRKRKRSRKQYTEEQLFIMQHPIYRIFYVSHDSQDMKIFSYITRELPDSTFRCNVFKAYKKNMALHIVRSLGQAFDVCHRLNPRPKKTKKEGDEEVEKKAEGEEVEEGEGDKEEQTSISQEAGDLTAAMKDVSLTEGDKQKELTAKTDQDLIGLDFDPFSFSFETPTGGGANGAPPSGFNTSFSSTGSGGAAGPTVFPPLMVSNNPSGFPDLPVGTQAAQAQLQLSGRPRPRPANTNQPNIIQENPFTEGLQTDGESQVVSIGEAIDGPEKKPSNPFVTEAAGQQAMWEMHKQQMAAQMTLLREQLKQETSARLESQARVEHLLQQNKQLLTHVQKLMVELEKLQSLQMAQLLASGTQSPPTTTSTTTATATTVTPTPDTTTTPTPSLPIIPEISSEVEPAAPDPVATPPPESPPPPPEAPPTTDSSFSQPLLAGYFPAGAESSTTSNTSSTTLTTTDSEQPPTPFDTPQTMPLLLQQQEQPDEQESSSQTSTPLAPAPDPEESNNNEGGNTENPSLLPDIANLPTNDPFAPQ